ncbi:MAG TPA: sugar nucleotidyltransferase, partial [Stellaceae bacterium]|nr:sugar nucleotidyltransferase [Stellaceae bacterium]
MIRQAVILCGPQATRFGMPTADLPTADLPTPLIAVGDGSLLDLLLFELGRHGIRRILLLAGLAAERMAAYVAATPLRARFGLDIEIAAWSAAPGSGSSVWQARDRLDAEFLLLDGASWFDINLLDLAQRLGQDRDALAVLALRRGAAASGDGAATLAGDHIVAFAEGPASAAAGLVSG